MCVKGRLYVQPHHVNVKQAGAVIIITASFEYLLLCRNQSVSFEVMRFARLFSAILLA